VLSLERVARRYGPRTIFTNLDLRLHRGERIALVGINGAGKSSLLRIAAGIAAADAGMRQEAERLSIGYFAQDQFEVLRPDRTAAQHMLEVADAETAPHVKGILGAFLFREDDVDKKVAALSGGEKARLMLARLLLQPHGLLVMDEPTNHLDISSREVLESAVKDHQGTILFTTHDRRFMDTVATAIVELRDGRLTRYEGNYSYYVTKRPPLSGPSPSPVPRGADRVTATPRDVEKAQKREEAERRNRVYRLLKPLRDRVGDLEARIDEAETELRDVEARIASPDLYRDPDQARAATLAAREARKRVDELYEAWQKAAGELEAEEARSGEY
jgi:ATP-binding cassette subfamily F protein 3